MRTLEATLHASAQDPTTLAYVLVFPDSNARWKTDQVIITKSYLNLVGLGVGRRKRLRADKGGVPLASTPDVADTPIAQEVSVVEDPLEPDFGYITEDSSSSGGVLLNEPFSIATNSRTITSASSVSSFSSTNLSEPAHGTASTPSQPTTPPHPIVIFEKVSNQPLLFRCLGYYKIVHKELLPAHSERLAELFRQKWDARVFDFFGGRSRTIDGKMAVAWAILHFEKDEESDQVLGMPQIEPVPQITGAANERVPPGHDDREGKSVNELLREMRAGDRRSEGSNVGW